MTDDLYELGMATRRTVMGPDYVERAHANATELDKDFQQLITEMAWGKVWSRPGIDRRVRHVVTIAILAALGRTEELTIHIRASLNTGVTPAELRETLMQVAIYAGVPAANTAFAIAKKVYKEHNHEDK